MLDQAEEIRQFIWGEDSYDLEDEQSEDYVEHHLDSVFCV